MSKIFVLSLPGLLQYSVGKSETVDTHRGVTNV